MDRQSRDRFLSEHQRYWKPGKVLASLVQLPLHGILWYHNPADLCSGSASVSTWHCLVCERTASKVTNRMLLTKHRIGQSYLRDACELIQLDSWCCQFTQPSMLQWVVIEDMRNLSTTILILQLHLMPWHELVSWRGPRQCHCTRHISIIAFQHDQVFSAWHWLYIL